MKFEDIEIEDVDFGAMLEESFRKSDSKNELVEGVIVKINESDAIVDIGRKNEALLSLEQLKDEDGQLAFKVGDKIEVVVTGNKNGRPLISYDMAKKRAALNTFIKEYDEEQEYIIDGVVTKKNKGGYVVECDGLEFFMPKTLSYLSDKVDPVGKKVKALIVKVDPEKSSIVVSRKELIERERGKVQEIVDKLLESKEIVQGVIKKITSYGMFVDVGGIDGLVHYSQISHKGPINPSKYFSDGDTVNVIALEYDKKRGHLSLSIKDANPDPWKQIDNIIGVGDSVKAVVSNIEPYGVFVDLGEELEAFLHVSEVSWDKNVKHPKDYLTIGDEINVEVIEIDKEGRRLRVSLKNLLPQPIDQFISAHKAGEVVKGTVSSITDFGAFVKIGIVEGLLHNQEVSWDKSQNAKNLLKVGDEIEVKIIKVDKDAGKVSLSRKALESSPVSTFVAKHKIGDIVTGKVKDIKDFGVFVALEEGVDALIRTEDLHPLKAEEISNAQEIKGVISFIDAKNGKIRVSVKRLERQEERDAMDKLNLAQDDSMTLGDILKDQLKSKR